MSNKIKGLTIEIGGDATSLNKALAEPTKRAKDLQSELREVEKLLKMDPGNTELLSQKQKLLADSVANTKEKLDTLKTAAQQAQDQLERGEISEDQFRALQREVIKTEESLKSLEKQSREFSSTLAQRLAAAGKEMQEFGGKVSDVGQKMLPVSVAIAGVGTAATMSAISFEDAFAGVRKTVDATEEQFQGLSDGIRDMAKEIPMSANNIAELAESAGQLGIKTENILDFTRVVADLGVATNIVGQEGAAQIARFANIVGMSQTEFDKFGSSVVALGNNFATTEAEILSMAMRLAGAGAQVGMSEADILGLATALSSVGIEAEMGGSAISRIMVRMSAAGSTADKLQGVLSRTGMSLRQMQLMADNNSKDFKDLASSLGFTKTELQNLVKSGADLENFGNIAGMSAGEFKKAFEENAAGALQAFIDGLANAEDAGDNAIAMLQEMGITEIRLRDSLLRAAGAGDLLTDAITLSNNAWQENAALTKEAEQRYATTASQLEMAKNQVNDLGIEIGTQLIPHVLQLTEKLKSVVDWFSGLSSETQKTILVIAAIVAAVAPLLIVIGKVITAVGTILTVLPKVKAAILAVNAAIAANPIGAAIAVIALLVAGLITLWHTNEDFRNKVIAIWAAIKEKIGNAVSDIRDFFTKTIPEAIDRMVSFFANLPARIWQELTSAIERIRQWGTNIGAWARSNLPGVIETIVGFFARLPGEMLNVGRNLLEGLWNGISDKVSWLRNQVSGVVDRIKSWFTGSDGFDTHSPSRWGEDVGENITAGFANGLVGAMQKAKAAANKVIGATKDAFSYSDGIQGLGRNVAYAVTPMQPAFAGSGGGAGGGDRTVNNYFTVYAEVREDDDINKVAGRLYQMQSDASREEGIN